MPLQSDKAKRFRELHNGSFVIANAWDGGSARILAALGFPALATSSGACAATLGRRDGFVTRDEAKDAEELNTRFTELDKNNDNKLARQEYGVLQEELRAAAEKAAAERAAAGGSGKTRNGSGAKTARNATNKGD